MALKKLVSDLTEGLVAYPNSNTSADTGGFNYGGSTSIFDTKVFNQRSIPYSQPLSRQENPEPLIPQILPGVNQEPNESTIFITDAPDGFIRGGETNAIKRAATDTIRINKFFISGEGITFISNQKGLQRSNPIIQEGGGNLNNTFEDTLNQAFGTNFTTANTNRTFNEENLIKQISEGGYTGNYYNRAGSNPSIQSENQNKYEAIHKPGRKFDANKMGEFNAMGGLVSGNRLITLGKKLDVGIGSSFKIGGPSDSLMGQAGLPFDVGELINGFNAIKTRFNAFLENPLETFSNQGDFSDDPNIGFRPGENIIYQYSGGPGSTYGIGDTILYRYQRTSGDYDHQGHPLSFKTYFKTAFTTVGSPTQYNFFENGVFNEDVGLQFLTNTVNENLFGGNNILGPDGLLSSDNLVEGLGNQIFGVETFDFAQNLATTLGFSGIGTPNPQDDDEKEVLANNYFIGTQKIGDKKVIADKVYLTGIPTAGFINHDFTLDEGRGYQHKPDAVHSIIEKIETSSDTDREKLRKSLPGKVGKFESPTKIIGADSRYNPTTTKAIEEAIGKNSGTGIAKDLTSAAKLSIEVMGNPAGRGSGFNTKENGNYRRESRIGTGDPGATWTDQTIGIDRINALDIQQNESTFNHPKYRDLVRFRFEAIRTDNPSNVDVMAFRAFLDDFGDSFTSTWNSFKYNGRGEEFYTYSGFKRSFSFGFKIAAQSREEMKPLYRKLNYLVSNTAPDYGKDGRMRGPYLRLCVGAYMDRTPGFLTSINIKWQKEYPFEIAINNPEGGEDREMHVLPHVLDVQCQFTPIHDFVPKKSIEESPFIIPGINSGLHVRGTDRKWLSGNDGSNTSLDAPQNITDTEKRAIYDHIAATVNSMFSTPSLLTARKDANGDGIDDYKVNIKPNTVEGDILEVRVLLLTSLYSENKLSLTSLRNVISNYNKKGHVIRIDMRDNLNDIWNNT